VVPAAVERAVDRKAPRLTPVLAASWDGQSGGFTFSIGRESSVDATTPHRDTSAHTIDVRVEADSSVVFSLDGSARWRAALRLAGDLRGSRFQLWVASHATGMTAAVAGLSFGCRGRTGAARAQSASVSNPQLA